MFVLRLASERNYLLGELVEILLWSLCSINRAIETKQMKITNSLEDRRNFLNAGYLE